MQTSKQDDAVSKMIFATNNDSKAGLHCPVLHAMAEEGPQRSDGRFRSVMETANDAIITATAGSVILTWNKAATQIFGYSAEEATGKPLTIVIPDEYKAAQEAGMERVSTGGREHVIGKTVELSGLHKDGRLIPIELSSYHKTIQLC